MTLVTPKNIPYELNTPLCWKECQQIGIFSYCWWECEKIQSFWKGIHITNIDMPICLEGLFLGYWPLTTENHKHTKKIDIVVYADRTSIATCWKDTQPPGT
ncbi:UNVERIFIED_CONTAM: hypothetical protein K2H54_049417 [Gekko kuhli]